MNKWKLMKDTKVIFCKCDICGKQEGSIVSEPKVPVTIKFYKHTDGNILSVCKEHNPFEVVKETKPKIKCGVPACEKEGTHKYLVVVWGKQRGSMYCKEHYEMDEL